MIELLLAAVIATTTPIDVPPTTNPTPEFEMCSKKAIASQETEVVCEEYCDFKIATQEWECTMYCNALIPNALDPDICFLTKQESDGEWRVILKVWCNCDWREPSGREEVSGDDV